MSARITQRGKEEMSAETVIHYMINAALFGLAIGAVAAIVAIFVAPK